VEVLHFTAEVNARQYIFEGLDSRQIASLLWQIFLDARRFFSTGMDIQGNLPQSLLQTTYNKIATGIVHAHLNVPYTQLMGQDSREASYSNESGGTPRTPSSQEVCTFRHVPAAIKTILRGAWSKYPTVTIAEIMAVHVPFLQYAQAKLGPAGSCLDFLCFGACKNPQCLYQHNVTTSVKTSRAEAVAPKLGAAFNAYDVAH
jgi:hypothetical protein